MLEYRCVISSFLFRQRTLLFFTLTFMLKGEEISACFSAAYLQSIIIFTNI